MQLTINVPKELESEFKIMPEIELSLMVNKILKDKLLKVVRFKKIVSKSKLTQLQADKLANEISISLSERYDKLSKG